MQFLSIIKWFIVVCFVAFFSFIGYWIIILYYSGFFSSSSKVELIQNLNDKEKEIYELKKYYNSIVPKNFTVYIEFHDDDEIDLLVYEGERSSDTPNNGFFMQWNIDPFNYVEKPKTEVEQSTYSPTTKSLELVKGELKWTDKTFIQIKEMLDKANCISIESGEPSVIGFARSGLGKYHYTIFNDNMSDTIKAEYTSQCEHIVYSDKVVLTYGSPGFGSVCFPRKDLEK